MLSKMRKKYQFLVIALHGLIVYIFTELPSKILELGFLAIQFTD